MTRRFQIYLAPPGAGPEYHHSGGKWVRASSSLDGLRCAGRSAFILPHPSQAGSPAGALVVAENYAALTRDTNR